MKIASFIHGLFFIPFLILASDHENNLTWIENNLDSIFDSLKIAEYANPQNTVLDFGQVSGEKFGFIRNQVIKYISSQSDTDLAADSVLIRIEQFNVEIVYLQKSVGLFNLGTETIRKNKIDLAGWVDIKSDNPQLKSLNIKRTFSEKLTTQNITELEESPYTFTKGILREASLWVNVIEPVMVISAVSLLVYLFFSVRS